MSRDITGTNAQGSSSGPRPDQTVERTNKPDELVLDLASGAAARTADEEDPQEPVDELDELGSAMSGDEKRPIDKLEGIRHVEGRKRAP